MTSFGRGPFRSPRRPRYAPRISAWGKAEGRPFWVIVLIVVSLAGGLSAAIALSLYEIGPLWVGLPLAAGAVAVFAQLCVACVRRVVRHPRFANRFVKPS